MKFSMRNGCEPKLFTEIVKVLEKTKQIERLGDVNNTYSDIHKAKKYIIKRLDYGT